MKPLIILLILTFLITSCNKSPHWSDDMKTCLSEENVDLLILGVRRFEKVMSEKYEGETIGEKYKAFVSHVHQSDLVDVMYHELQIKETTKLMRASDLYQKIWQKSSQWVLNDRRGTPVYLINGFAEVPRCLASTSQSEWLKAKVKGLETSKFPVPSNLANEILNSFSTVDYEDPYNRLFIAISLCYTQSLAYYDRD